MVGRVFCGSTPINIPNSLPLDGGEIPSEETQKLVGKKLMKYFFQLMR